MADLLPTSMRAALTEDVGFMERCRRVHGAGKADERMTAYFQGLHHPHQALPLRIEFIAFSEEVPAGYIAGHLTSRFGYAGELQYLFVALPYRQRGVGRRIVQELGRWFLSQAAERVCVNVDTDSETAAQFYRNLGASPFMPHWSGWENITSVLG